MTKWVALALGALLALVGAVCIGLGYDGVQTARGSALLIAGAVALTGGVLIFALFAILGELQASLAGRSMDGAVGRAEPPVETVPEPILHQNVPPLAAVAEAPPSPPVFHEPPAPEQAAPAAPAKPASPEPKVWERPSSFRASTLGAARSVAPAVVASGAVVAGAAAIAAAATPVPSKDGEPVSEPAVAEPVADAEAAPGAPELEDHVERAIAEALADESLATPSEEQDLPSTPESHDAPFAEAPRQPSSLRQALGLQDLPPQEPAPQSAEAPPQDVAPVVEEPKEEPKPAPTPLIEVEANPSVAAGYAWLERALASDDGRKSPALEWLRARQRSAAAAEPVKTVVPPPPDRVEQTLAPIEEPVAEAAPEAPREVEPEVEAAPEAAAPHEPAPEPALQSEQAPSSEAPAQIEHEDAVALEAVSETAAHDASAEQEAPAQATAPEPEPKPEAPVSPAPTIIGRYSSGGSDFTLYSDGSIDAQTDQGMFHYGSMAELRAHIESLNAQS